MCLETFHTESRSQEYSFMQQGDQTLQRWVILVSLHLLLFRNGAVRVHPQVSLLPRNSPLICPLSCLLSIPMWLWHTAWEVTNKSDMTTFSTFISKMSSHNLVEILSFPPLFFFFLSLFFIFWKFHSLPLWWLTLKSPAPIPSAVGHSPYQWALSVAEVLNQFSKLLETWRRFTKAKWLQSTWSHLCRNRSVSSLPLCWYYSRPRKTTSPPEQMWSTVTVLKASCNSESSMTFKLYFLRTVHKSFIFRQVTEQF